MSWSLNEVEGLARKAARGAGFSWGLSEEAGKAARWLAGRGLPGPEWLAHLLSQNDGTPYAELCPMAPAAGTGESTGASAGAAWRAPDGPLCPVIAGAALCDHAGLLSDGGGITLDKVSCPMLLLPFAAGAAEAVGQDVTVAWPGTRAAVSPRGSICLVQRDTLGADMADVVEIAVAAVPATAPEPETLRHVIPAEVLEVLGAFAHRTYAPDTPESRLAGAGAGLTDND